MEEIVENGATRAELGVYFLSNNREINWAYAFLTSFRQSNPTLPLTLIPYNDEYDRIAALAERFDFNVLLSDTYKDLDGLNRLTGSTSYAHTFRKFAAFWGVYDRFFYLDTDVIVTADLRPLDAAAREKDVDLGFVDGDIEHVYKPGALREKMITEHRTRAFNTGTWWSERGLFTLDEIAKRMEETTAVRGQFVDGEQAYINYCFDVRDLRREQFSDLIPKLMPTGWAPLVHCQWDRGNFLQTEGEWAGREVYLIHFAGSGTPHAAMPNYQIYLAKRIEAQGLFKAQLWNLRSQAQKIKWQLVSLLGKKGASH